MGINLQRIEHLAKSAPGATRTQDRGLSLSTYGPDSGEKRSNNAEIGVQPRTNQIKATPTAADAMPTIRNQLSGVLITLSIARLRWAGKAAKISPSMANTRPSATTKSFMPDQPATLRPVYFGAPSAGLAGPPGLPPEGSTK